MNNIEAACARLVSCIVLMIVDLLTVHAKQDTQLLEALWRKLSSWDFDIIRLEILHNPFHARDVFRELGVISLVSLLDLFYSL